jgi:hypothetical protein
MMTHILRTISMLTPSTSRQVGLSRYILRTQSLITPLLRLKLGYRNLTTSSRDAQVAKRAG